MVKPPHLGTGNSGMGLPPLNQKGQGEGRFTDQVLTCEGAAP